MSEDKKRRNRIQVLDDERARTFIGTCANCKKSGVVVRRVESIGFMRESRGFYDMCFQCVGPHVKWKNLDTGDTWNSPVGMEEKFP